MIALLAAAGFGACSSGEKQEDQTVKIAEQVRGINKLILAQMSISKLATIEDLKISEAENPRQLTEALLDAIKIGDRKAAFSYSTYLQAYIDLSNFSSTDIALDPERHTAIINLPPIETQFAGRDATIREDHYRVTGLRSQIGPQERAEIKEKMNQLLREEVENNDSFRTMVTEKARAKCTDFFRSMFEANGYSVDIRYRN